MLRVSPHAWRVFVIPAGIGAPYFILRYSSDGVPTSAGASFVATSLRNPVGVTADRTPFFSMTGVSAPRGETTDETTFLRCPDADAASRCSPEGVTAYRIPCFTSTGVSAPGREIIVPPFGASFFGDI